MPFEVRTSYDKDCYGPVFVISRDTLRLSAMPTGFFLVVLRILYASFLMPPPLLFPGTSVF